MYSVGEPIASGDESVEISDRESETQFEPQEGDEEILWEVIEIIAEKPREYRVMWAGVDSRTGRPWNPTWVKKSDCTDDLVYAWKKKKKALELGSRGRPRGKGGRGGGGRTISTAPKRSNGSNVSKGTNATVTSSPKKKRAGSSTKVGQKRTHSVAISQSPDIESLYASDPETRPPPSKKPKTKAKAKESLEEGEVIWDTVPPQTTVSNGKKKLEKADLDQINTRPKKTREQELGSDESEQDVFLVEDANPEARLAKGKRRGQYSIGSLPSSDDDDEELPPVNGITKTSKTIRPIAATRTSRGRTISTTEGAPAKSKINNRHRRTPSSSPPPVPTPRKGLVSKETTLVRRTIKEPVRPPSLVDHHKIKSKKTSRPDKLGSLSPNTKAELEQWSRDLRSIEQQTASTSKSSQSRSPSVETAQPLSPVSSPPAPVLPKRTNSSRNGNEDSYRRGVVPETEPESSNNTQTQTQSQSQPQEVPVPVPAKPTSTRTAADTDTDAENAQEPPPPGRIPLPATPDSTAVKRHLRQQASLIGKMKPRTLGSVSRTQPRWSLYDHDHDSNYAPLSPLQPMHESISRIEEEQEVGEVDDDEEYEKEKEKEDGEEMNERQGKESKGTDRNAEHEVDSFLDEREPSSSLAAGAKSIPKAQLQPLRHMTPSEFAPYLPTSSISAENPPEEEPISSIEEFKSSDEEGGKSRGHRRRSLVKRDKGKRKAVEVDEVDESQQQDYQKRKSLIDDAEDDDRESSVIHDRGLELAEQARQERRRNSDPKDRNGPLIDFGKIGKRKKGGYHREERDQEKMWSPVELQKLSPPPSQDFENSRTQEDEEMPPPPTGPPKVPISALRQEEEESTQDLLAEQDVEIPPPPGPPPREDVEMGDEDDDFALEPASSPAPVVEQEPPREDEDEEMSSKGKPEVEVEPEIGDLPSSPAAEQIPEKELTPEPPSSPVQPKPQPKPESRSVSEVSQLQSRRQTPIQQTETRELTILDKATAPVPPTLPLPDSKTAANVHVKPVEIARLEALLVVEQAKSAALQGEVDALEDALINASVSIPVPDNKVELEALRTQLVQQQTEWEQEKAILAASIAKLAKDKADADKDKELIREEYLRASAFVSDVRAENAELEKQAKIASEQATTGVQMIRKTFEMRVKALEDDVKNWKRMALFAVEKDARTNDDIRRRAAEEPELRAQVEELEDQLASAEENLRAYEDDSEAREAQVKELEVENEEWRKENMRLKARLEDYGKLSQEGNGSLDMVHRCQWRLVGSNESCDSVFMTVEELQAHMFAVGHLDH